MISNTSKSKNAPTGELADIRKYIGVASVSVLALNPNNAKLRSYGWQIPEDAEEPKYVTVDSQGRKSARLRMLVQIHDLDEKPVIALDFWIRPDVYLNQEGNKCQIIDSYGRTAWATKAEVQAHKIPQYENGPAKISSDYKLAHPGEAEIVAFLMKYLNVTPLQIYDRVKQCWVPTKDPGRVTIDNWKALCEGNIGEIAAAIALQPENRVKVILGIRNTEDNKSYQTFLSSAFIGNGAMPGRDTGEYSAARKAIDKAEDYAKDHNKSYPYSFSSLPVKEWSVSATEVKEETSEEVPPVNDPAYFQQFDDDLPM